MQERVPALIFTVRGRQYGLLQDDGAALLPWLQRYAAPGPVPGVPAWLLGLLSVQGTVQPIVDLGAYLGYGVSTPGSETRLIFIERDEICVGLLVDAASGIRYLDTIDYTHYNTNEPLVAGSATVNGEAVRMLDGIVLIDSLARTLETPTTRRA